jgi:tRNA(adenine34) deaminase
MPILLYSHEYFMKKAMDLAHEAMENGEVPVGAIVVAGGKTIIGKGYNQTERLHDVTAHAEMIAITAASTHMAAKYLPECTLYVTLEPCVMCAGAIAWTQMERIVFAAHDTKKGFTLYQPPIIHPKMDIIAGIMAAESEAMLKAFFKSLRKKE